MCAILCVNQDTYWRRLVRGNLFVSTLKGKFMPMVGKKEFGYGAKGMAMAKAEAKKTGKPMKMDKSKMKAKKKK